MSQAHCPAFCQHCLGTRIALLSILVFAAAVTFADSKNPADYSLRLHIYTVNGVTFYHNRAPEETRGDGRANVYENGVPRGLDFSYDCFDKIKPSFGFETYPAKWKQKDRELVVLFPEIGRANKYFTCTLKTDPKEYAYFLRNGHLESEPSEVFQRWMLTHDYDPEHGKNTPSNGASTRLDEARQLLTGSHKDTQKAGTLLHQIVEGNADPNDLVWACIYLGYIDDREKNRQSAIAWYQRAAGVKGVSSGASSLIQYGIRQPLVWIRHLDAGDTP